MIPHFAQAPWSKDVIYKIKCGFRAFPLRNMYSMENVPLIILLARCRKSPAKSIKPSSSIQWSPMVAQPGPDACGLIHGKSASTDCNVSRSKKLRCMLENFRCRFGNMVSGIIRRHDSKVFARLCSWFQPQNRVSGAIGRYFPQATNALCPLGSSFLAGQRIGAGISKCANLRDPELASNINCMPRICIDSHNASLHVSARNRAKSPKGGCRGLHPSRSCSSCEIEYHEHGNKNFNCIVSVAAILLDD